LNLNLKISFVFKRKKRALFSAPIPGII